MTLKELRREKGLTQKECALYLGVPYRTYLRYENENDKKDTIKYQYMFEKLSQHGFVDEERGLLTIDLIKKICKEVFPDYGVEYCYLFGSYAKGKEKDTSDVDLLVSTSANGLQFYEMIEILREKLKKKVDLLEISQLNNNSLLIQEILKDGIKIYG
ncbi:MAG: nucleotidyltransferase domain-containing protein [Clostridia bacterium]|nr:nucleotidyltransferase domain-containing protein [Clostridia bacterium]